MITSIENIKFYQNFGDKDPYSSGIYLLVCEASGKYYVGKGNVIFQRLYAHQFALEKNIHPNPHLQRAFNKYGMKSFSCHILENCNKEQLNDIEKMYISEYRSKHGIENVYNIREGGEGGDFDELHSQHMSDTFRKKREQLEESMTFVYECYPWLIKLSQKKKREFLNELQEISCPIQEPTDILDIRNICAWRKYTGNIPKVCYEHLKYKLPPWTRLKLKKIQQGKKHSQETKIKMSLSHKGIRKGIPKTEEQKEKISKTLTGKYKGIPRDEATISKIVETKKEKRKAFEDTMKFIYAFRPAIKNWRLKHQKNLLERVLNTPCPLNEPKENETLEVILSWCKEHGLPTWKQHLK